MDFAVLALVVICLAFLLSKISVLWEFVKFVRTIETIPGPANFFSMMSLIRLLRMTPEGRLLWMKGLNSTYKDGFFKVWIGTEAMVRIRKPEHLELVLPNTANIKKSMFYRYIECWLGQGLLTSSGEKWFKDRRLLTPAFHFNILEQFAIVMNEKTQILVKRLEEEIKQKPGESLDIFHFAIMFTLDTICETAMGLNVNAQERDESEYVKNLHRFSRLLYNRFFAPWGRFDFIFDRTSDGIELKKTVAIMHKFTTDVIRARKITRQQESYNEENTEGNDKRKRKAFLDLLLDANENSENPLTDDDLREQVDTFMFTGHDTTAAALSWCLFCLGTEPEVQKKVHEELDEVFGDSTEIATMKQMSELKYLDRVIKEALRLYPSAPEFLRDLQKELEIEGHKIPKNVNLAISPYWTHRDPDVWPDPDKFDPDRFLPEHVAKRHPYAYIPFSAGPRNCIGQKFAQLEEKIALTAILRKFRFESIEKRDEISVYAALILRPSNGIPMYVTLKK